MNKTSYYKFGGALFILLIAIYLYIVSFNKMSDYTRMVNHTHEVMVGFEKITSDMKSAQMLASVMRKRRTDTIYELYKNDANSIPYDFKRLDSLVADNPRQVRRVAALRANFNSFVAQGNKTAADDSSMTLHSNGQFKNLVRIQRLIEDGINEERELLSKRKAEFRTFLISTNIISVIFIVTAIGVIIATAASTAKESKKRSEVEQFLGSVINTSQHGIITYKSIRDKQDAIIDFLIIYANEAMATQLGRTPQELIGRRLTEMSPDQKSLERMSRYIRLVDSGQKDSFELSLLIRGRRIFIHVILAKLNDGFTATSYDITDLKNVQQDLEQKVQQLESTNTELEQFAYVASHDLQEPLRKIKTFASLINERFNEPAAAFAKVYLSKVIESAERMSHLINDLLNLSDLSKQEEAFVATDLNEVLKYVLVDFDLITEEKQAIITIDALPQLEAINAQMNQLFYNLINNALKFVRKDVNPRIQITSTELTQAEIVEQGLDHTNRYYRVSVCDNGIGFRPEYADKIFNIFQRLHHRKSYSGSGIGLAICRKIVLNHHGIIRAEGVENEGARFHIILPAKQQELA